jgi:hypothetical protein
MKHTTIKMKHLGKDVFSQIASSNLYVTNSPMSEQIVIPPAHVWDKIEQALNDQDRTKSSPYNFFSLPFKQTTSSKRRFPFYFATIGTLAIASLVWMWR